MMEPSPSYLPAPPTPHLSQSCGQMNVTQRHLRSTGLHPERDTLQSPLTFIDSHSFVQAFKLTTCGQKGDVLRIQKEEGRSRQNLHSEYSTIRAYELRHPSVYFYYVNVLSPKGGVCNAMTCLKVVRTVSSKTISKFHVVNTVVVWLQPHYRHINHTPMYFNGLF